MTNDYKSIITEPAEARALLEAWEEKFYRVYDNCDPHFVKILLIDLLEAQRIVSCYEERERTAGIVEKYQDAFICGKWNVREAFAQAKKEILNS
ncbi:MAG: hypothetical protein E6R04_11985 [Spirochaetes bacterium]|nr:MAG: hypothetical protein E6R04_11985 [Spirochaetota bacterium]